MQLLTVAFLAAAVISGIFAFIFIRELTATWNISPLEGIALNGGSANSNNDQGGENGDSQSPSLSAPDINLEVWDGGSRVNILMMGLDFRDWASGEGPPRTDTMILFTLDPIARTAGMMSIPRDLWVNIPGFDLGKINTAYQLGEAARLPGGGPGLAVRTVEEFLGIKINYYFQVDFGTFVDFIQAIDGVKVRLTSPIELDVIGKPIPLVLEPGIYTLSGDEALAFARARNTAGADFDRSQRQQQLILAIRDRLLIPVIQARLIGNAAELYQSFSGGIRTNITFDEAFKLGLLALDIDESNIQRGAITVPDHVTLAVSPDGLQILKPVTQNIRILRDEIFATVGQAGPATVGGDNTALIKAENAKVAVYNGTLISGLAGDTQDFLINQGVNVTVIDNAESALTTTIYDYTGKPYTIKYLVEVMGISKIHIFYVNDPDSEVDIEIVLGSDWSIPSSQ